MPSTSPNQRTVKIHREAVKKNFLGIKNENWTAAARNLGAHAFMLYMYFAANADNFNLALSPVAVNEAIGMPRSTYHDQVRKLVNKGYLVPSHGNTYDFYEVPQQKKDNFEEPSIGLEENPNDDRTVLCAVQEGASANIQINKNNIIKKEINKEQINSMSNLPEAKGSVPLIPEGNQTERKKEVFIF